MRFLRKCRVNILIAFLCVLCGCSASSKSNDLFGYKKDKIMLQQINTIMEAVQNDDAKSIASLFCPYVQENHPELEEDIQEWMDQIDGKIISYEDPVVEIDSYEIDNGVYEELAMSSTVEKIKTNTGHTYTIIHASLMAYEQEKSYVGTYQLILADEDAYIKDQPHDVSYYDEMMEQLEEDWW